MDKQKTQILNFVAEVTDKSHPKFVPIPDRIAAFDNDGTLWTERPLPPQIYFILENAKTKNLTVDYKHLSKKKIVELAIKTQTGMDENSYRSSVLKWYNTAKHPQKNKLFKDLKFKPMTELIQFLKDNNFTVFIVSGGSRDFMRTFVVEQYGIPEYRTVGSSFDITWNDSLNVIERNPKIELINDHIGKPVGIYNYIGKKPIFIAGNSDGDYYMMKYAATSSNPFLNILITHTDSIREYEYNNKIGIDKETLALERCQKDKNWLEVSMKKDWNRIY
ncbi:MAG: HAD family hydrolase [Flavicella sp.]